MSNLATDVGAFTEAQAARVTGLSVRQLRQWARTGMFPATHTAEGGGGRRIYSFRDLVGLRTLAAIREVGRVSLTRLREAAGWLKREHETPWSSLKFWVGPKGTLYFGDPKSGAPISAGPPYQAGIPVALDEIVAQVRQQASALRHRAPADVGQIARYRGVMGNARVFAGTRILVQTVAEMLEDGVGVEEILREFPTLTAADVAAARPAQRRSA